MYNGSIGMEYLSGGVLLVLISFSNVMGLSVIATEPNFGEDSIVVDHSLLRSMIRLE